MIRLSVSALTARLERPARSIVAALSLLLVSLTVFGSYKTHFDIRFSFFYTLPIALTAWFVGRWAGVFFSFLCAFAWLGEVLVEHAFIPTDVRVACWNAGILLVFFLLFSILLSSLHEALGREKAAARHHADPRARRGDERRQDERDLVPDAPGRMLVHDGGQV